MKAAVVCLLLAACGSSATAVPPPGADGGGSPPRTDAGGSPPVDAGVTPDASLPASDDAGIPTPRRDAGPPPPDPCIEAGTCAPGTWVDVTPPAVDLVDALDCGNFGIGTVAVDPSAPSHVYFNANCQGIWKSLDYGATWTGPINTGAGGAKVGDSAGGITIAQGPPGGPPVLYFSAIRGMAIGFSRSTDDGVSFTTYDIAPAAGDRQDVYAPTVDPYDANHLLMAGHEQDLLVESTDGGQTWTNVALNAGMNENGGTGAIFFLDTGSSFSTRVTWLWLAQTSGGTYGTWRTSDGGQTWTQVDKNEHPHGAAQIYQPDSNGVVYMAGAYSALGWGVLRSTDYGSTWAHVGTAEAEGIVFGTPKNVYTMWGWAIGEGQTDDPSLQSAAQPGTGAWSAGTTPATMTQGPVQVAMTSDGVHSIAIAACMNGGVWRYVEP